MCPVLERYLSVDLGDSKRQVSAVRHLSVLKTDDSLLQVDGSNEKQNQCDHYQCKGNAPACDDAICHEPECIYRFEYLMHYVSMYVRCDHYRM